MWQLTNECSTYSHWKSTVFKLRSTKQYWSSEFRLILWFIADCSTQVVTELLIDTWFRLFKLRFPVTLQQTLCVDWLLPSRRSLAPSTFSAKCGETNWSIVTRRGRRPEILSLILSLSLRLSLSLSLSKSPSPKHKPKTQTSTVLCTYHIHLSLSPEFGTRYPPPRPAALVWGYI